MRKALDVIYSDCHDLKNLKNFPSIFFYFFEKFKTNRVGKSHIFPGPLVVFCQSWPFFFLTYRKIPSSQIIHFDSFFLKRISLRDLWNKKIRIFFVPDKSKRIQWIKVREENLWFNYEFWIWTTFSLKFHVI